MIEILPPGLMARSIHIHIVTIKYYMALLGRVKKILPKFISIVPVQQAELVHAKIHAKSPAAMGFLYA